MQAVRVRVVKLAEACRSARRMTLEDLVAGSWGAPDAEMTPVDDSFWVHLIGGFRAR